MHSSAKSVLDVGLAASPPATRREILRRLSLDLTGLPPTLEQLRSFQTDDRLDAYERQVDRLLADPAFGEHWARKWLDLARYADSAGYADDPPRTIWAYRDWVVRALNNNLPVDEFSIQTTCRRSPREHKARRLDCHCVPSQHTLTNNEGGTNDEEFRSVAVVDRVNTTMAVWMGITMACAQCHTHKYDPFTQEEYFQLFAVFNQSQDADRRDESPTIPVFTQAQITKRNQLKKLSDQLKLRLKQPSQELNREFDSWLQKRVENGMEKRFRTSRLTGTKSRAK